MAVLRNLFIRFNSTVKHVASTIKMRKGQDIKYSAEQRSFLQKSIKIYATLLFCENTKWLQTKSWWQMNKIQASQHWKQIERGGCLIKAASHLKPCMLRLKTPTPFSKNRLTEAWNETQEKLVPRSRTELFFRLRGNTDATLLTLFKLHFHLEFFI